MPKRGAISLGITGIALVLLLNFKTPQTPATLGTAGGNGAIVSSAAPAAQTSDGATTAGATTAGSSPSTSANGGSTTNGSTTSAKSGTITGSAVDTPYGPVQLQVTLSSGKITDVQAIQYPSQERRSLSISQYAIPTLIQETLQAQSAQIDSVSGATYTSQGYMQSLQSALDQARG